VSHAEPGIWAIWADRRGLTRIIHDGSSRKRADAKRDWHSEAKGLALPSAAVPVPLLRRGTGTKMKGASPQQNVDGLNGDTARHSHVSTLAAEAA